MDTSDQDDELRCRLCGSDRIIRNAMIEDSGEHSQQRLHTLVAYKAPHALVFTGPIRAELRATLCCGCGHVALHLTDPQRLWEEFVKAPGQQRP